MKRVHESLHAFSPGWEVSPVRNELFTDGYGFIVDYVAEILKHLRSEDFTGAYKEHFSKVAGGLLNSQEAQAIPCIPAPLNRPLRLQPLASAEFLVEEKEESGGSGASFLVEWTSDAAVSEPVIEAVMIGTAGSQGISFLSAGRVVAVPGPASEHPRPPTPVREPLP